jgi:arylsulfatase A-like enzyme
MGRLLCSLACCIAIASATCGENASPTDATVPMAFGHHGKFKMLYDARQRPQSVLLHGRLFIVYNGDAEPTKNDKGSAYPMLISYDLASRAFSSPVRLGKESSTDHHYSPIIWADKDDYLHVLFGCHKTPGTHLTSRQPVEKGTADIGWKEAPQIAPKLSYPTVYRIHGDKELIYYRTDGHTSSWTYRISDDNGKTWRGPDNDVTDLDSRGRLDWSSYQTKLPSKDGKYLHVVYTDYDDNKNSPDPQRFFNPRYNKLASNEWKYNLSYVKINLNTHEVSNANGRILNTPIDIDYSKTHCEIWDTQWRGAGVPPAVAIDENDNPAFLHVLSEGSLSEHQYYYVRRVNNEWKHTPITYSSHQWNSCHLSRDADDMLHAYVIAGEGYLEGGYMDRHGGGRIEEWVSSDKGNHWTKRREVSPNSKQYAGWRFNNVQPVVRPDGSTVDGMLLYYGWKDENDPKATAFLLHEAADSREQPDVQVSAESARDTLIGEDSQPNVLFLAIDDLNDWIGALGGHPQARTPNLDRLISKSVVFHNAHCAAPVCSASRHALLSGLRPSTTGWYSNTSKSLKSYTKTLGETVPMPTHFKHNGYKTLAAGKIFHKGTSDIKEYDYWDKERSKYEWPQAFAARGHGYQGNDGGHFHPFPPDGGAIYQKYGKGVSGQSLCWGALEKADIPPEGMPDEQIAAWAVDQLQQNHDKPFFLAVGFVRPHVPYTAPKEFFDLYPIDTIVMPQVPADELDDIPLWGKAMAYGTIDGGDHHNVQSIGPHYWREMVRAYLACVSFVDAQAGSVLDALENGPHAKNTIVVFWSDHGQHLGEKRHWRKQALWEESTRVPLAFRLPGDINGGSTCGSAVSLIDIYPTMLELCHLPNVKGLEGISLTPQLKDPETRRVEPAITTWHYNNHAARSLNFRYIRYRDGSEELYDHRTDPGEHHNLSGDPKLASIKKKLAAHMPSTNVMPESLQDGETDTYGRKVERMQADGVPEWLGRIPSGVRDQ